MTIELEQFETLKIPSYLHSDIVTAVTAATDDAKRRGSKRNFQKLLARLMKTPETFLADSYFSDVASKLIHQREMQTRKPIEIRSWGKEHIPRETFETIKSFAGSSRAVAAALMPDAHGSCGMPVGGVIALENAICPGAVGLDIACRMKLSIFDVPIPESEFWESPVFKNALLEGSCFGFDERFPKRQQHEVMDRDWKVTKMTRRKKTKAWAQLGSSGGGNHFVEFGSLTVTDPDGPIPVGSYVALLSHSGSRGTGADVAKWYTKLAVEQSKKRGDDSVDESSAFLDMDSDEGNEYWLAMNLMGAYAKANHDVIHENISKRVGGEVISEIENHHNFCWRENHFGKELYVHRKGATPAHRGTYGVIPGSMNSPAFVVVGKGEPNSLCSASHGAGRRMDRGQAKAKFSMQQIQNDLQTSGIHLIQGSVDEAPQVYKDIHQVMECQNDLVDTLATFQPKIVRMAGKRI